MSGDIIEIIDFYNPKSDLEYSTREVLSPETTMELVRQMEREYKIVMVMKAYRKKFPDSTESDEQVRTHVERILDERDQAASAT